MYTAKHSGNAKITSTKTRYGAPNSQPSGFLPRMRCTIGARWRRPGPAAGVVPAAGRVETVLMATSAPASLSIFWAAALNASSTDPLPLTTAFV